MLFSFVLPLAFVLPALANQLNPRGFWAGGGFGLSSKDCPSDTYDNCGTCCPNGFSMDDGCAPAQTWVCCPEDNPCVDALYATPFCVDSTWVLWNTTAGDLFCCLQGQTGTNDMQCVNAETDLVASLSASKIGQPSPTGAAATTVPVSGSAAASTSAPVSGNTHTGTTTRSSSEVVKTTTNNGIESIVTSLIGEATSHSDSTRILPPTGELMKFGILGTASAVAGILGVAVLAARAF